MIGLAKKMRACLLRISLLSRLVAVLVSILIWPSVACCSCAADEQQTQYVLLVTIDGMRPEELFTGADNRLIDKEIGGVYNPPRIRETYWHEDPLVRRERLMPFIWSVVAKEGQLYGSALDDCQVLVENGKYFSYPGYQELLCGFPDKSIASNDKVNNKNKTVLEWLHEKPDFSGKVASFASWDVVPYIINAPRSGIYVNAGWQEFDHVENSERREFLNRSVRETPHLWEYARFDNLTFAGAMEYLQSQHPRILYLSLDEPDDWCHSGRYDLYLESSRRCDDYLRELWEFAQNSPVYRGKTSLVVTVDHGRGHGREGWKNHSAELPGSEQIWIAVLGPDTPATGVQSGCNLSQGQVATTIAALLGYDLTTADSKIAPCLPDVIRSEAKGSQSTPVKD
ncbi:alkaline phosphatase family protein [Bythopirellula goksoeyrii]|uniref:Type I phosphodiesterase / nucleotide pyrophosphatase n=1 Tax=Bythopirellula goksoeyrii TaxID=1400387 RepID=A0A5B9Q9D5_9BACT|nr:AP protein [Bythopirellula goksoeyrii]QEG34250.1 hypothetical protein Pr1d_15240 [Bythopirellula goksoeyrii]